MAGRGMPRFVDQAAFVLSRDQYRCLVYRLTPPKPLAKKQTRTLSPTCDRSSSEASPNTINLPHLVLLFALEERPTSS